MDGETCWAPIHKVAKSRTWLKRLSTAQRWRPLCLALLSAPPLGKLPVTSLRFRLGILILFLNRIPKLNLEEQIHFFTCKFIKSEVAQWLALKPYHTVTATACLCLWWMVILFLNILWPSQKTNLYFAQCLMSWKLMGTAPTFHKSSMVTAVLAIWLSLASGLWVRNEVSQLALVVKNPCQHKKHKSLRFNPPVGKIPWRRAWQPIPVFLPGESYEQRNLEGYSPYSCKQLDTTETTWHTYTSQVWATVKEPLLGFISCSFHLLWK